MYERFTNRAREVMYLANQEAKRLGHDYIGTEHILLGLLQEDSGVAAHVLMNLRVDLGKARLEVEKVAEAGPYKVTVAKLLQTPGATKVIDYAMEEARDLQHNYVGTEHLLLGLLREEQGLAARVLTNLHLNLEDIRRQVLDLLGEGPESSPLISARVAPAIEDLSWLPADIQAQVGEFNATIRDLERNKEEAVAEQDFERAAHLRDEADKVKKKRNATVAASLPQVDAQEVLQRLDHFHKQIEALVQQEKEAISKGYFGKANKLRDELNRLTKWKDPAVPETE
jgi:ATP-dependent Clp protease ATP-binding subunit ClpA